MAAAGVHATVASLPPGFSPASVRPMPLPRRVLMCPPDHFDVVDVKNPFMEGQVGRVRRDAARREWEDLKAVFERIGLDVGVVPATPGCEDMVFCANPSFPGLDAAGQRVAVLSHMRHPSRRREVPAFDAWYRAQGYRVEDLVPKDTVFEGCGDALWHPGRALVWGGHGDRTSPAAYPALARRFDAPVLALELSVPPFYHLDTCLCLVDERTALAHLPALQPEGVALLRHVVERVVEVDADEASRCMACNAAAFLGRHVVIQRGAVRTAAALRRLGYEVHEVETAEFMKSGGSVFCLKMQVF